MHETTDVFWLFTICFRTVHLKSVTPAKCVRRGSTSLLILPFLSRNAARPSSLAGIKLVSANSFNNGIKCFFVLFIKGNAKRGNSPMLGISGLTSQLRSLLVVPYRILYYLYIINKFMQDFISIILFVVSNLFFLIRERIWPNHGQGNCLVVS